MLPALLLAAGAARATSDTVIGFDDLAPGTAVSTQYQAQGLKLGAASAFGLPAPGNSNCGSPTVASGTVPAVSPPNYAQLATCPVTGATVVYYAAAYGALLNYPRATISVSVRLLTAGVPAVGMTITAYDAGANVVATGTANAASTGWTTLAATQASGPPAISYFAITTSTASGSPPQIAIDDLRFDQAGAPLSAAGAAIGATAGSAFTGTVATVTDADPTAVASDYAATITWGDGTTSSGSVAAGPATGQFTVSGSHTWSAGGTYPVHAAVQKVNGRTVAADTTATVAAGPAGGGSPGSPSAALAVLTPHPQAGEAVALSGAGSAPGGGQIISYDWDFNGDGRTDTSTGANPNAHFIFAPGIHTVGLTVTNSNGQQATTHLSLTVVPPPGPPPFTPDGGQGACQPTYDNGSVHIIAECVQTLAGGGYIIETRQLDLNGMVLVPKAGGYGIFRIRPVNELGIGSGTQLSGPAVDVELLNTPIGDLVLGGSDLTTQPIWLTFQAFHPPLVHLAGGPSAGAAGAGTKTLLMSLGAGHQCAASSKDPGCCPPSGATTACATLPGDFPLTGQINVYLNDKGQTLFDVQVGLDLQAVNFQATGALEVIADLQSGINLGSLQFTIPEAGLASIFEVKDASFTYYFPSDPDPSKRDTWQAKGTFIFGPLSQPSLAAELDFRKGQFHYASMLFTAPSGTGIPIYPGILLNQLGGAVGVDPLQFGGTLGASIATQLQLSLSFKYSEATDTQLGFFGGQGTLSLSADKIATLAADVYSDGYTDAALDIDLHFPFDSSNPVVQVTGHIGFWDEPTSGRWEADGSVALKLWIINAEVAGLVNDQYVAGCADINGFGAQGRYRFSDGNIDGGLFAFSNCSDQLKQYKEQPVTPHTGGFVSSVRHTARRLAVTAADTRGGGTITLPGGTLGQELEISSASGTPVVDIYGPGHRLYTTPSAPGQVTTSGGDFISAIAPDPHRVIVLLRHPRGGTYNIQPTAASAPISSVASAQDVPPARVRVRVRRSRGRTWTLAYRIANYVAGSQVQFVERGRDSTHVLGTARRPRGVIRFVPQDAIGRRRRIVAYLRTRDGAPLRTLTVGHYTAPAALRPGPASRLRFRRSGNTAVLTWAAARAARRYFVQVWGSDGRRVSMFTAPGRRRVVLGQVLAPERFTATVVAQGGPNLLPGPPRRMSLRPAGTGLVQLLSCTGARCRGRLVTGTLSVTSGEVHAVLARAGRIVATGIAGDLHRPSRLALTVRRALPRGRYILRLSYRHHGRTYGARATITIT